MLSHKIQLCKEKTSGLFKGKAGSEEHKRFIHKRTLINNQFDIGDEVYYNGAKGVITDILDEAHFNYCEWEGLRCLPIEVYLYGQNDGCILVHPKQLRK